MIPISTSRKADLDKSADRFNKLIIPILIELLGEGEFYSIEASNVPELEMLDLDAGIDCVYKNGTGIKTINSKVRNSVDWHNFQIRYDRDTGSNTDYNKIKSLIENDSLYPYYKVQAYIENDEVQAVYVIKTKELWDIVGRWIRIHGLETSYARPIYKVYCNNGYFIAISISYLEDTLLSPSLVTWRKK